jgi:hypothetical protein
MFNSFKEALIKYKRPYILVSGDLNNRIQTSTKEIDKLLNNI